MIPKYFLKILALSVKAGTDAVLPLWKASKFSLFLVGKIDLNVRLKCLSDSTITVLRAEKNQQRMPVYSHSLRIQPNLG